MADRLEAAAEKQWEVHLRTQQIMNRSEKQGQLQPQTTRSRTFSRDEAKTHRKSQHENENERHVGKEVQQENILSRDIDNHKERIILNEKRSDCKKYPSGKANMM